jgi:hypothetical protein
MHSLYTVCIELWFRLDFVACIINTIHDHELIWIFEQEDEEDLLYDVPSNNITMYLTITR